MKIYSDDTVTAEQIGKVQSSLNAAIYDQDAKQNRNIRQLRIAVGVSFLLNVALTLALNFNLIHYFR